MALREFFGRPDSFVKIFVCPARAPGAWDACTLTCTSPVEHDDITPAFNFCCDLGTFDTGSIVRFEVWESSLSGRTDDSDAYAGSYALSASLGLNHQAW
eukprot:2244141-Prymnesium_polylepis.1